MTVSSIATGYDGISLLAGNAAYDPAATWLIQRVNGTGSSGTITFSSIPQNYKHLQIRMLTRDTTNFGTIATAYADLTLNGDTGSNYTWHALTGNGSSAGAVGSINEVKALTARCVTSPTIDSNIYGAGIIDIHDYASTSKFKTIRTFGGVDGNAANTQYQVTLTSNLWRSTSAVTSITFTASTAWATGSTFALYGMVG